MISRKTVTDQHLKKVILQTIPVSEAYILLWLLYWELPVWSAHCICSFSIITFILITIVAEAPSKYNVPFTRETFLICSTPRSPHFRTTLPTCIRPLDRRAPSPPASLWNIRALLWIGADASDKKSPQGEHISCVRHAGTFYWLCSDTLHTSLISRGLLAV